MNRQLILLEEGAVDAIVGYRSWDAELCNGVVKLSSVVRRRSVWRPGAVKEAVCVCPPFQGTASEGDPPQHTCGIYAWNAPIVPRTPTLLGMKALLARIYVCGEVLLWGEVCVHERGYRAQFARPSAFYVMDGMHERVRRASELAALQWDVPVVRITGLQALAGTYTPPRG